MNDGPVSAEENVSVVAIFDLKEVRQNRISCQTPHEFLPGLSRVGIDLIKELSQTHSFVVQLFEERVQGSDIVEHLNDPAVRPQRYHFIGKYDTIHVIFLEGVLESMDELHRELFYIR